MDTDSLFISTTDRDELKAKYPNMFGSEVGQFTGEMKKNYKKAGLVHTEQAKQRFYMNKPKEYCVVDIASNFAVKLKFKGIGKYDKIVDRKDVAKVDKLVKLSDDGKFQRVVLSDYFNVQEQIQDLPPALSEDLFVRLQKGEEVCVVSSQIQKGAFDKFGVSRLRQNFGTKFLTLESKR
jgi:hypothetical protein